ncbi:uncharacterized protein LOC110861940 [Folsomia candida]|uniref:Uncharacterized protein n=1 Tax=Folsomia candida TaxID=158441 RepID=A0A226CZ24_FOLCA|nr:uncharacterized protein LOC110861940 [Folsomia candida]OXA38229.1 hypothetical protein Fcan01_27019 [Folsomia candida]
MTASIIMKLELSNQLELLHNHLIETFQVIQDFLEIEDGVGPDSSENLNLKQTLYKFVTQMSSFTSNVTSLKVKLNKYQEDDGDPKGYHNDVVINGSPSPSTSYHDDAIENDKNTVVRVNKYQETWGHAEKTEVKVKKYQAHGGHDDDDVIKTDKNTPQQDNLIEEDKTKNGYKFPPGCKIKTEELEVEEVVVSDEEDADEECEEEEEDLLPYEMEEVETFPVGEEGYEEEDDFDFNYDEYPEGTSPPEYEYKYDMHPVQFEYSTPPNLPTERKSSSRKQIIGLRNIDETPIIQETKPVKINMRTRTPMWNGKPVSLSTLRVMRFRSRMTEEQKMEQRRKDRERVARKRAALRAARALQQGDTNGNSNSSESYESLCIIKKKEDSP